MGWSIINVTFDGQQAIDGKSTALRELVKQLVDDGFEPFSTAGIGDKLVMSFRKQGEPSDAPGRMLPDAPGYL